MILHIFLFPTGYRKMHNIYPEQIYDYFTHVVSYEKAKKLTSVTIIRCICHITLEMKGHNENFNCHYFKCYVCRIIQSILVERRQDKLLLLVNMNNYKTIS